jgi:hypothetical protein
MVIDLLLDACCSYLDDVFRYVSRAQAGPSFLNLTGKGFDEISAASWRTLASNPSASSPVPQNVKAIQSVGGAVLSAHARRSPAVLQGAGPTSSIGVDVGRLIPRQRSTTS